MIDLHSTHGHRLLIALIATLLAALLLLLPSTPAGGNQHRPVVVVLETMTLFDIQSRTDALIGHLARLGLRRGRDVEVVVLNAQKDVTTGKRLLAEVLDSHDVDVVVTVATLASQAARQVLGPDDPPQVFFFVSDPVGAGIVEAVGKPTHANITGVCHNLPVEISIGAVLRLIEPIHDRKAVRLGVLHTDYPSSLGNLHDLQAFADGHETLELVPMAIRQQPLPDQRAAMVSAARAGMHAKAAAFDYLWIAEGPLARDTLGCAGVIDAAPRPVAFAPTRDCVRHGALTAISTDAYSDGYEAALLVAAILKGEPAGAIPVMRSQRYFQGINTDTAKTLGITIPDDVAANATFYPER